MRVFIAVAVVLTTRAVIACSCIIEPSPKSEFKSAEAVFLGEVVAATRTSAEMMVLESFKGAQKDRIVVTTNPTGSSCGYGLGVPGTRHLIYAWTSNETGSLHVSMCSRSWPEEGASCDLEYLRKRAAWWRSPLSSIRLLRWMGRRGEPCPRR